MARHAGLRIAVKAVGAGVASIAGIALAVAFELAGVVLHALINSVRAAA